MFDDNKKGNQKPNIESKESMHQSNEKGQKDIWWSTTHYAES